MFSAMSLGKKIGLGFTVVLLLMAGLGGVAIYEMNGSSAEARVMAEEYAPAVNGTADAQQNLIDAMLASSSYGFNEDPKKKALAEASLTKLEGDISDFEKLAADSPHLTDLKSKTPVVKGTAQSFGSALKETAAAISELQGDRVQLDEAAQNLVKSMDAFYGAQKNASDAALKEINGIEKLRKMLENMDSLYSFRNVTNQIRIASWKAQTHRDYTSLATSIGHLDTLVKKAEEMHAANPDSETRKHLETIRTSLLAYQLGLKEMTVNGNNLHEANRKRSEIGDTLTDQINDITVAGVKGMATRSSGASASLKGATWIVTIGLVIAAVLGVLMAFGITHSIVKPIQAVIDGLNMSSAAVASASGQVSQASQDMARGASEQASSLEETSASLEEMSSMTRQNADNASQANTMASEASGAAETGVGAMQRMSQAIQGIKKSSDDTAKILKTIDEIAFQTNLLALNAAVEAARAGDAGKGFAVVAEEVRNLAQRSAEAAKNTSQLIEESRKNADNGVRVTQEVGDSLQKIAVSVKKLQQLNGEVSAASTEQSKGIDQVNTAVSEMDKVTQSNAASAEESAAASEELSNQASDLAGMVNTLAAIVSGPGSDRISAAGRPNSGGPQMPGGRTTLGEVAKASSSQIKSAVRTHAAGRKGASAQVIPLTNDELADF